MARPKKQVIQEQPIVELEYEYPFNQFPFKVLDKEDLELAQQLIDLYDSVLIKKHPSQLGQLFELGKTYPNYQNLLSVLKEYIKEGEDQKLVDECKKVIVSIGFNQIIR